MKSVIAMIAMVVTLGFAGTSSAMSTEITNCSEAPVRSEVARSTIIEAHVKKQAEYIEVLLEHAECLAASISIDFYPQQPHVPFNADAEDKWSIQEDYINELTDYIETVKQ